MSTAIGSIALVGADSMVQLRVCALLVLIDLCCVLLMSCSFSFDMCCDDEVYLSFDHVICLVAIDLLVCLVGQLCWIIQTCRVELLAGALLAAHWTSWGCSSRSCKRRFACRPSHNYFHCYYSLQLLSVLLITLRGCWSSCYYSLTITFTAIDNFGGCWSSILMMAFLSLLG